MVAESRQDSQQAPESHDSQALSPSLPVAAEGTQGQREGSDGQSSTFAGSSPAPEGADRQNRGEHTPTPWRISRHRSPEDHMRVIVRDEGQPEEFGGHVVRLNGICECHCYGPAISPTCAEREANAEFIVRAVNSHQALVEAAKHALEDLYHVRAFLADVNEATDGDSREAQFPTITALTAALALAEGSRR